MTTTTTLFPITDHHNHHWPKSLITVSDLCLVSPDSVLAPADVSVPDHTGRSGEVQGRAYEPVFGEDSADRKGKVT